MWPSLLNSIIFNIFCNFRALEGVEHPVLRCSMNSFAVGYVAFLIGCMVCFSANLYDNISNKKKFFL